VIFQSRSVGVSHNFTACPIVTCALVPSGFLPVTEQFFTVSLSPHLGVGNNEHPLSPVFGSNGVSWNAESANLVSKRFQA
jgi:hypothetical protein